MEAFDRIADIGKDQEELQTGLNPFYAYEPWDVEPRPQWVRDQALLDGVDLYSPELMKHIAKDPHPFQSGYLLSVKHLRIKLGGSRIGKSIDAIVEAGIMVSGELPFSLRYPKGKDTGIKRAITPDNVRRFGRFDARTGTFIDHNESARVDPAEWDCSTIRGVGVYPSCKIAPPGSQIWIGTYQKAFTNYWWPRLAEKNKMLPDAFIDKARGKDGLRSVDNTLFMVRDCKIVCITYESGYQRFEAETAWGLIADEEMLDQRIFQAMQQHAKYLSMLFTPYNGITWSKDLLFPDRRTTSRDLFHATQYDSPYQTKAVVDSNRENMQPWDIAARVWGIPTDIHGEPFFDRIKLMNWLQKFVKNYRWAQFNPVAPYFGVVSRPDITAIPGLMETQVAAVWPSPETADNRLNMWKVYEDRKPNTAYVLTADPAEGATTPNAAADVCAAIISRPPAGDETRPVVCATLRSTLETIPFARTCSHALRYYNNALLAAETKRGACNAAFASELRDYPYWYKFTSIQDSTGAARQQNGFDTNAATRSSIFEYIQEWIGAYDASEDPMMFDEALMLELAQAVTVVKMGKKRCDHTNDGTLDTGICFGILLYVYKHSPDQVKCNLFETPRKSRHDRAALERRHAPCGMDHLGYRDINEHLSGRR